MSTCAMIETIDITRATNPDLDQTCLRLVPVFNAVTVHPPLQPAAADFAAKTATYSGALKQQLISIRTEEIDALERNRDRALTEVFHAVANELLDTDAAVRSAAHAADVILRTYGNPARRPMDTQTNIVNDIIADLTAPGMAANLARLPVVKAATDRLAQLNIQFSTLFDARIAEHEHRETGIVRRTRRELEAAFRLVINKINAFLLLFETPELADTVAAANAILEEARHLINRRAGHRHHDGEAAGESPDVEGFSPAK